MNSPSAVATWFSRVLIGAVLLGLVVHVIEHDLRVLLVARVEKQRPRPVYPLLPVPGTATEKGSRGVAGADFSQVYTSGQALRHGESAYAPVTPAFRDKFGRPPGYPPPMNWLYLPLSYLKYPDALLVHTLATLAMLLGVSAYLLWRMQLARRIPGVLLAQVALYLLTPLGLTHLERGQFDLFMTVAAALCVACAYAPGSVAGLAVASGLIGALKWTAPSFLGCFSALGFLIVPNNRRWSFFAIPLVTLVVTAGFYAEVKQYWHTIQVYEIDAQPYGLTLQNFLPRVPAKLMPILATLLPVVMVWSWRPARVRRDDVLRAIAVPFSLALMNLAICFGTLSYEYHTVATLGMLPGLVVWLEREPHVSLRLKALTAGLYAAFLVIAFRVFDGLFSFSPTPERMTALYAGCTLLLLAICVRAIRDVGLAPADAS